VTVSVDAVVYFNVIDSEQALCSVDDFSHSTRLLAATTLRNVLGTKVLLRGAFLLLLHSEQLFYAELASATPGYIESVSFLTEIMHSTELHDTLDCARHVGIEYYIK
jgi:hypothetical protein